MKRNAYNFSNDLARIGSALSRAMLGSASDDASLARARASDALAGKYSAETDYQKGKTNYLEENNAAIADALGDSRLVSSLFGATGLKSGNLPTNPTGRTGPFIGNDPATSMQPGISENAMRGLVRSIFFGGVPGNPQQSAASAQTLANMNNQKEAYKLLSESGQSPDRQAAIRLGQNLTEYFDSGVAQSKLANTLTAAMDKNAKTLEGKLDETEARYRPGGQGDRDKEADNLTEKAIAGDLTAAKERWNNFKANKELEASKYGDDVQAGVDRDKNKAADATVRYRHDNRTVEFTVEPGKLLVIDPVSAKKAKIPIQTGGEYKGLYILDGGEKPGAVQVKAGKGDVYMDEATADALGIDQNDDGQFVIKGAGFKDSSSSDGSGSGSGDEDSLDLQRYNKEWRDTVQFYPAFADVPNHAESAMKKIITEQIKKDMKPVADGGRGMDYTTAYASNADVTIGAGSMRVGSYGSRFFIPKFYFDAFVSGNQKNESETRVIGFFRSNLGYSQKQSQEVAKEILAARR